MMARRFPGSSDMGYSTYRQIESANRELRNQGNVGESTAGGSDVVARQGPALPAQSVIIKRLEELMLKIVLVR